MSLMYVLSTNLQIVDFWVSLAYLVGAFLGVIFTMLLLWHDVDAHNPFLREVCGGKGQKTNCGAVLGSKGATFLGVNWSAWGFAYFATFFTTQFIYVGQLGMLSFWSGISLLAAPYVVYSIYYQWKVIGQWCPLCLGVQAALIWNTVAALLFFESSSLWTWDWYIVGVILVLGIGFLLGTYYGVPLLKRAKDGLDYQRKWTRLRYNQDIFEAMLYKGNPVSSPVDGLGILVGNPDAKREIIKVCNPYCGPCSKAHPELEELIKQHPDFRLRIIFTATGEQDDHKTAPVAHLLAIQEMEGRVKVKQALDDWYLAPQKDYGSFAEKYPMNNEEQGVQKQKVQAMHAWCNQMKIRATPTIYIDGYELPDSYRVEELKNLSW